MLSDSQTYEFIGSNDMIKRKDNYDGKSSKSSSNSAPQTDNQLTNMLINTKFKIEKKTHSQVKIGKSLHASLYG